MVQRSEIDSALKTCCESLVSPDVWSRALDQLAQTLGAETCVFCREMPSSTMINQPLARPENSSGSNQGRYWARQTPHNEISKTGMELEKLEPCAVHKYASGLTELNREATFQFRVKNQFWCLRLLGHDISGALIDEETSFDSELSQNLSRLIETAENLAHICAADGIDMLQQLGTAAMLVGLKGKILYVNRLAENLFDDYFMIRNGRPWIDNLRCNRALSQLVSRVLHSSCCSIPHLKPVIITRDGIPWLLVEALPVKPTDTHFDGCMGVILVINNLRRSLFLDFELLSLVFSLTQAEAHLAVALAMGKSLSDVATESGVSICTLRCQLRSIFSKTSTYRQAQLVALLSKVKYSLPEQAI